MNSISQSRFLIGATGSGSGKTTLTLGLVRALHNKGFNVQPFKCGPDYIDTKYHDMASGNKSINLDLFLSSENHIKSLYNKYCFEKDICIAEGVMGLFDGYDKMKGSSAQIAETLDIPVVLVLNAKSMAYSAAPILYGFKNFYRKIKIAGVIFNFVGSESHYDFLKDACTEVGVEPLGYLPKDTDIEIPSRHLGLKLDEEYRFDFFLNKVANLVERYVDIDKLLALSMKENIPFISNVPKPALQPMKIAIARDDAFNFTYHENIEYLKAMGCVTFFSPINDKELPEAEFVYLPGGYPELFLKELVDNKSMMKSIRTYIENNGKLLAECGGMMYLSSSIEDTDGIEYPMANIFRQKASMKDMKLKLGYRRFEYNGLNIKGHEFHYSSIDGNIDGISQQYNAKNIPVETKLLRYKNAVAGYTHLYWSEMENIMNLFK